MGLFDWFARRPSLAEGLETWKSTPGAVLLDVRTPEEYRAGHIPGAQNLPLNRLSARRSSPVCLLSQRRPQRPGPEDFGRGGPHRHGSGRPDGLPRAAGIIRRKRI